MATASPAIEESETLNCPVCITKFNNPRILPCLHTICEKCIRNNIESQGQSCAQFKCPICKMPSVLSDSDLDKLISKFIPDSTIKSMEDLFEIPDNKDDQCDECKREGENKTAVVLCVDCQEKLCECCLKSHKRNKVSSNHTTVSIHEVAHGKTRPTASFNFERNCALHPGKPLELFCVDHRELYCAVCSASNHRECNNIRGIDDVVKEQTEGFALNKILTDFMKIKTEMNKVITDKNDNVVQLAQEKEKIVKDMDVVVDRIIVKLNELRKSFRDEAEHLHEGGKLSILKYQKFIEGFLTNIINSYTVLINVRDHGSPRQKFVMFETIRSQIRSHHQQLKKDIEDDAKVHLTLKSNEVLQDMEKSLDSLGVVELTFKTNTVFGDSFSNIDDNIKKIISCTPLCGVPVDKSDTMTSSLMSVKTVTRKNLGEVYIDITGGAFLKDGRLVMADNASYRLLQLDHDYNIAREYKIGGPPRDVAAGNDQNEMYMSVYIHPNNYIYRCTLDTDLKITQRILTPRGTWGIDVSGDTIIAATDDGVLLLSQDGSTLMSVPTSADSHCGSVAVSHTPLLFYHGDGHSVVSRTFDGKELFRYSNDKLKAARSICVHHDIAYICGRDSHNVHVISCDGQRSRILLDKLHSISRPRTVLFNQQKNELIVTSDNEDTVIEVYRLD